MSTLTRFTEIRGARFALYSLAHHFSAFVAHLASVRIPYAIFAVALIALGALRDVAKIHFLSANGTDSCGVFGSIVHDFGAKFFANSIY